MITRRLSSQGRSTEPLATSAWRRSPFDGPQSSDRSNGSRYRKALKFGSRKAELMLQVFNLFNAKNLQAQFGSGRVGNALSASFGRILSARPASQVELAIRVNW